jgi:flagellin-like hook-associated protein FlgL
MLYRISQRSIFRNITTNLGFLTYDMSRINGQIATGKRVNKPSDDPSGGALILAMRTVLADVTQYNRDVALADDWLKTNESILMNMKLIVERGNVLSEQMSTDTYTDANMDVAAKEVEKLMEGLIKMGNTRIGDRYIFAGQKTEIPPFVDKLTIWDALADSGNSKKFTGGLKPIANRTFEPRPDLAAQTQQYLVEVTKSGGVDGDSLSNLVLDPQGSHNTITFEANATNRSGSAGNNIRIWYENTGVPGQAFNISVAGDDIHVVLATDPITGQVTTTAKDLITAIENDVPASGARDLVSASLVAGSSGNGPLSDTGGYISLTGGFDGAAQYRVSVDGGKTWSLSDQFTASELNVQPFIYNNKLGHASLTTKTTGLANDLFIVAQNLGTSGQDIAVEFVDDGPGTPLSVQVDPANPYTITVHLANAAGTVTSTAEDVMNAINAHAVAGEMVSASLANYREGGSGVVDVMAKTWLSGADPQVMPLGHAQLETEVNYAPPDEQNPNLIFTAVAHGAQTAGSEIKVEMVNPGPSYGPTDVTVTGNTVTVNLATDADGNVIATAQDVAKAVNLYHFNNPGTSLVTANLPDYTNGGGIVTPFSPTDLTGGSDDLDAADHGALIRFGDNGSTLVAGDRFTVDVSYYQGDDQDIELNASQGARVKINITGEEALGETAGEDNILDTLARLKFALEQHDTEKVGAELPRLGDALEKLTSQMAGVGLRLARNEFTYNILSSTQLSSTERMSRVEDLDIADAITNLQTKQTAYQATLATTSLITKLSLVDYIR